MNRCRQSDSSFDEIVEGKACRRKELMNAIRSADPAVLAEAAERLIEAMRNRNPSQRRRRLAPQPSASNLRQSCQIKELFLYVLRFLNPIFFFQRRVT